MKCISNSGEIEFSGETAGDETIDEHKYSR